MDRRVTLSIDDARAILNANRQWRRVDYHVTGRLQIAISDATNGEPGPASTAFGPDDHYDHGATGSTGFTGPTNGATGIPTDISADPKYRDSAAFKYIREHG